MSRRNSIATALLLLGSLHALPAAAGSGSANQVFTVRVAPGVIQVETDGSSYTDIASQDPISADVRVMIKTGGRLKSMHSWLTLGTKRREEQGLPWFDFKEFGYSDSFPRGERPKEISPLLTMEISPAAYRSLALDHCDALAKRLRSEGKSEAEIFGEDRFIELGVRAQLQYDSRPSGSVFDSYGRSDNELDWEDIKKITLVCQGSPEIEHVEAPPHRDPVPPFVRQASLAVLEQPGITGEKCSITLSGVIETSAPDIKVKFRYQDDAGHQSAIHSVRTDHSGVAMFDHDYDVPVDQDGPETGKVRIVGVSHDFESASQAYEMNCQGPSFQALMPPTVEIDVVPFDKVKVGQQVCYAKVKLYAKVEAQNADMSGIGVFIGDYYISKPQPYDIEAGEMTLLGGERDLDWTSDIGSLEAAAPAPQDQPKQQTIQVGFNLTNANNTVVASVPKKPYTIKCYFPAVNTAVLGGEGGLTMQPRGQDDAAAGAPRAAAQLALVAPLPDLKIQHARPGKNKNRLRVRVVNGGPGKAGASKLKAVYRRNGKNVVRTVPVKALGAGARTVVVVDFGLPVKDAKRISLTVDAPDRVKEQNEQNNKLQFKG
jgi:hypothetical protein